MYSQKSEAVHAFLDEMRFAQPNRDGWRDLGSVRVCLTQEDERCDVYVFDGKCGGILRYEINLRLSAPMTVVLATIRAVVEAEQH